MPTLSFEEARQCVLEQVRPRVTPPAVELVALDAAAGRVLAKDIASDRDYPPLPRSMRDGFAVAAARFDGKARLVGEVRAGERYLGRAGPGECVEIMTGAPMPDGTDAVIMVEHVQVSGDGWMTSDRRPQPGDNFNAAANDCAKGQTVLPAGSRIGFSEIAVLATVGVSQVPVFRRPSVAVLSTGDEVVPVDQIPEPHQVRNSNAWSVAAQVAQAGGVAQRLPVARDEYNATRGLIEQGLRSDLLLLSGGVSAGKYDLVERVLAEMGAEFYFDRVKIQPGQPLVFGRVRDRFFFGLPGNPLSTMVTFAVIARLALELLCGQAPRPLPLAWAQLTEKFHQRPGLTRFLPAMLEGGRVTPVRWGGSGDVMSMARANALLVSEPEREDWQAGDWIQVLPRE